MKLFRAILRIIGKLAELMVMTVLVLLGLILLICPVSGIMVVPICTSQFLERKGFDDHEIAGGVVLASIIYSAIVYAAIFALRRIGII